MDNFDLIGTLRTYAATNDWLFYYGTNAYQNIEADGAIEDDQLILTAQFNAQPIFVNGLVTQISYTGIMMLGRKFESAIVDNTETEIDETQAATMASLDETMIQKYDRRLLDLMQLLSNAVGAIGCANELDVNGANFRLEINQFDTNIDFIAGELTFVQG